MADSSQRVAITPTGPSSPDDLPRRLYVPDTERVAKVMNLAFMAFFGVLLALLLTVVRLISDAPERWTLLLAAFAAHGVGCVVGFVYATNADETVRFSPFAKFFNGFLGGAAVTDLTKGRQSVTFRALRLIATAAGLADGAGFVGMLLITFGCFGFFFTYLNKSLFLNLIAATQSRRIDDLQSSRQLIAQDPVLARADPGGAVRVTAPVAAAAQKVAGSGAVGTDPSLGAIKSDANALVVAGHVEQAERLLRGALPLYPNDPDLPFYLANILLSTDRPGEAARLLKKLAADNVGARASVWKLLGYALLYDPSTLDEAEAVTKKYLAVQPDDAGAWLNLACVYGQRGPKAGAENRQAMLDALRHVVPLEDGRHKVRALTAMGDDFAKWADDEEFQKLIARGA